MITQRVGVNNMSHKRQDRHKLTTYSEKLSKDMDKMDFRLSFRHGKRWRQVKKVEDERMLREWKK